MQNESYMAGSSTKGNVHLQDIVKPSRFCHRFYCKTNPVWWAVVLTVIYIYKT